MSDPNNASDPGRDGAYPAPADARKAAPAPLSLHGRARTTARFKPKIIITLVVGGAVLIALAIAMTLRRAHLPDENNTNGEYGAIKKTDVLADLPSGYADLKPPPSEKPSPASSRPKPSPARPSPPRQPTQAQRKAAQELAAARQSDVFFTGNIDQRAQKRQKDQDTAGFAGNMGNKPRLVHTSASVHRGGSGQAGVSGSSQDQKSAFLNNAGRSNTPDVLQASLQPPRSRYELTAGTTIPAALETKINSDLPGKIMARVTRNVYDSKTGHYLLIPQGAKLIGKYNSHLSYQQSRVQVVWSRLIMPNGTSIDLNGMEGTDGLGVAGVHDQVDYHTQQIAGAILLSTAIAVGGNLARGNNEFGYGGRQSIRNVIGNSIAQNASQVGQRIVQKQLQVQPTNKIRPGFPIRVFVDRDIVLKPYDGQ